MRTSVLMAAVEPDTEEIQSLVESLEGAVIDGLRTPIAVAALMANSYFVWEWQRALLSPLQVVQGATLIALALAMRLSMPHAPRKLAFVVALAILPVCALFHYGPLLGTGVHLAAALLAGSFFYGSRGALTMI